MKTTILRILCILFMLLLFVGCTNQAATDPTGMTSPTEASGPTGTTSPTEMTDPTDSTEATDLLPNGTPLSQQELQWFNDEFFSPERTGSNGDPVFNIRNMFLRVTFTTSTDIDLGDLFREGIGQTAAITQQEIDAVNQKLGNDDPLDLVKVPEDAMKAAFLENTGLTIEQTNQLGIDKLTYLEEYRAYYHKHSDTAYTLWQMLDGVKLDDGSVVLLYTNKLGSIQTKQIVTLMPNEDSYWFVSNQPAQ